MTATSSRSAVKAGSEATRTADAPSAGAAVPALSGGGRAVQQLIDAYTEVRVLTAARGALIRLPGVRMPAPRRLVLLQLDLHATGRLASVERRLHARAAGTDDPREEQRLIGCVQHAAAAIPAMRRTWWVIGCVFGAALVAQGLIAGLDALVAPGQDDDDLGTILATANDLVRTVSTSLLTFDLGSFSAALLEIGREEKAQVLAFVTLIILFSFWVFLRPFVWAFRVKRSLLTAGATGADANAPGGTTGVYGLERQILGREADDFPVDLALAAIPVLPFLYLGLFMAGGLVLGGLDLENDDSPVLAAVLAALLIAASGLRFRALIRRSSARRRP